MCTSGVIIVTVQMAPADTTVYIVITHSISKYRYTCRYRYVLSMFVQRLSISVVFALLLSQTINIPLEETATELQLHYIPSLENKPSHPIFVKSLEQMNLFSRIRPP